MKSRIRANGTSAKKLFTSGAVRVHKKNFRGRPMRGGYRL